MVYITGDIHGQTERITYFANRFGMTEEDIIVILGDVGANYYLGKRDKKHLVQLNLLFYVFTVITKLGLPLLLAMK